MCGKGKKITDGEADEKRGAFHRRNLDLSGVFYNCSVLYLPCQVKAMNLSVWATAIHVAQPELHFFLMYVSVAHSDIPARRIIASSSVVSQGFRVF